MTNSRQYEMGRKEGRSNDGMALTTDWYYISSCWCAGGTGSALYLLEYVCMYAGKGLVGEWVCTCTFGHSPTHLPIHPYNIMQVWRKSTVIVVHSQHTRSQRGGGGRAQARGGIVKCCSRPLICSLV